MDFAPYYYGIPSMLKDSIGLNPHPKTLRDYRSKPTIMQLGWFMGFWRATALSAMFPAATTTEGLTATELASQSRDQTSPLDQRTP